MNPNVKLKCEPKQSESLALYTLFNTHVLSCRHPNYIHPPGLHWTRSCAACLSDIPEDGFYILYCTTSLTLGVNVRLWLLVRLQEESQKSATTFY